LRSFFICMFFFMLNFPGLGQFLLKFLFVCAMRRDVFPSALGVADKTKHPAISRGAGIDIGAVNRQRMVNHQISGLDRACHLFLLVDLASGVVAWPSTGGSLKYWRFFATTASPNNFSAKNLGF